MSSREDLEADARHETETERSYFEHENFHTEEPVEGCWLCEQEIEEAKAEVEAREENK